MLLLVALFNTLSLIKSSSDKKSPITNMVQDLFENIDLDQIFYLEADRWIRTRTPAWEF